MFAGDMGGSKNMGEIIACKGTGEKGTQCKYDSTWFCKNPACNSPVMTSTMLGTYPSGCPKINKRNCKDGG